MSAPAVPGDIGGAAFALRSMARHMHPDDARHVTKVLEALERQTAALLANEEAAFRDDVTGINLIAAERARQVSEEGWTAEHDADHVGDEMAIAAACYAVPETMRRYLQNRAPVLWPWHPDWWKPSANERLRELVKAGALIAAEIDRLRTAGGAR